MENKENNYLDDRFDKTVELVKKKDYQKKLNKKNNDINKNLIKVEDKENSELKAVIIDNVEEDEIERIIEIIETDKTNKSEKKAVDVSEEKEKNSKRKHKKLRIGEKVFLILNLLIIFGIIGIYAYRAVYYYKVSHEIKPNITLKEKLTSLANIAYQDDGLYEDNGYFYYKGLDVNNYVYYSGRLFRIIDIQDGIRIIDNDTSTSIVWGLDSDYNNSIISSWLQDYLSTLKDYDFYLKQHNWCNERIDVSNYNCNNTIFSYVGLLSTKDYLEAGGKNSYLNNETYFWTINQDMDGKALYINNEGGINNITNNMNSYYSYGIRPVITLRDDISIISGDGTRDNPFIIEELGKAMLRDNSIGDYVKYNNSDFRILKIENDGVVLILDGTIDVQKNYNDAIKYLNNEYLKGFNKDELVKINYSVNEYNYGNKYNYKSDGKTSNYVTLPKISDMFLNEYNGYWLNNISDSKLGLYYIIDENNMFFGDLKGNKHILRPVIKLNSEMVVSSGIGTKIDPLMVGDNNVEED